MTATSPPSVSAAVEGIVDEAILRRIFLTANLALHRVYIADGKSNLLQRLPGYNHAARWQPWIVLIDLDQDAECAPAASQTWLPEIVPNLCLRSAVRAVEAWLFADPASLAQFLRVPIAQIPPQPESVGDPKLAMVNLARRSRRPAIVEDMTPRPHSGRSVGPAYASRLIEYANQFWQPQIAKDNSDSLHRVYRCLGKLVQTSG
ncbi:MAG: hypothetical protein HY328_03315 [Chloroflexi bacterium]|nr:hypothetical protein [Chloroflexota bacterium]